MGRVLAYSDKTPVEMFAVGDNVLGIQGHPEYTSDILLNLIDRLVNNNTITVSSISAKLITISKHLRPWYEKNICEIKWGSKPKKNHITKTYF